MCNINTTSDPKLTCFSDLSRQAEGFRGEGLGPQAPEAHLLRYILSRLRPPPADRFLVADAL